MQKLSPKIGDFFFFTSVAQPQIHLIQTQMQE